MRKLVYIIITILIIISIIPIKTEAITLGEYEAKLKKYQSDAANNAAAINQKQSQINSANSTISSIKQEMKDMTAEVEKMKKDIVKYNDEIKEKTEQTKQILAYYQLSDEKNIYIEYLFGSKDITDLIYRASIVKQMTDYNNQVISELKNMIKKNQNREKELNKKEKELDKQKDNLADRAKQLSQEKSSLSSVSVSIAEQVRVYQQLVNSYKKAGCKSNDIIGVTCARSGEAGVFRRPTRTGYVTSEFGFRWGKLHRGLDIGSGKGSGEKIYPVANGKIIAKDFDNNGALILAIEHYSSVKGKWYTSIYGHMSSYAPGMYVGRTVTSDQYLGYMGSSGYAFGVHLHMEVIPCRLFNFNDRNCSSWASYVSYANGLANSGFKGPRSLIGFPSGTYNSWSTR